MYKVVQKWIATTDILKMFPLNHRIRLKNMCDDSWIRSMIHQPAITSFNSYGDRGGSENRFRLSLTWIVGSRNR
jgi:hypothetical protein